MKKINPLKASLVSSLSDQIKQSKSVAVIDYKGLKVSQVTELRKNVRKAGGEMLVTKNTFFKLAANIKDLNLEGTSAFIFSKTDEVSAVKAIADFAKKNQLPSFKAGLLGTRLLSASEVAQLANIPDKQTLVAKTVGSLKSPLFRLTYSLNWNLSKLVRVLDAVRAKKAN